MSDSMHILDQLRQRGYEPQEDSGNGEQYFDRRYPDATLRVILSDDTARLVAFDRFMVPEWDARFCDGTPSPVILAALNAAEKNAARAFLVSDHRRDAGSR